MAIRDLPEPGRFLEPYYGLAVVNPICPRYLVPSLHLPGHLIT